MTAISNASLTTQAAQKWAASETAKHAGDALAIIGLASVFTSPLSVKDGDTITTKTLANWCKPTRNSNGAVSAKLQGAIRDAALLEFFGITPSAPVYGTAKSRFSRVCRAAAFIHYEKPDFTFDAKRNVIGNVPLIWASEDPLFNDKGELTKAGREAAETIAEDLREKRSKMTADDAMAEAVETLRHGGKRVTCDGSTSRRWGKLKTSSKLAETLERLAVDLGHVATKLTRKGKAKVANGVSFAESVAFAQSVVAGWMNPDDDGDVDVSATKDVVAALRALRDTLDTYLSSDDVAALEDRAPA